jgi:hypothetical protein
MAELDWKAEYACTTGIAGVHLWLPLHLQRSRNRILAGLGLLLTGLIQAQIGAVRHSRAGRPCGADRLDGAALARLGNATDSVVRFVVLLVVPALQLGEFGLPLSEQGAGEGLGLQAGARAQLSLA